MISVVRYGHRKGRDQRITTHVGLVARAFGADEFVLAGSDDQTPIETLRDVTERWGGDFKARTEKKWRSWLRNLPTSTKLVHLTMYGLPLSQVMPGVRQLHHKGTDLAVFVGAEKVPPEVYDLADFNVAVGNQPHSEVAALAVFLDRLFQGSSLEDGARFEEGQLKIVPQPHGKKTLALSPAFD